METTVKNNSLATASLIVGIVGILVGVLMQPLVTVGLLLGIVAIVLGIIANNQIKASNGQQKGKGMATIGIILGALAIAWFFVFIFIYLPAMNQIITTLEQ